MKNDQFGKRMGRWETPIPLNSEWLCAARWIAKMELADPVPVEDRDGTAAFRDPEKPQNPPIVDSNRGQDAVAPGSSDDE